MLLWTLFSQVLNICKGGASTTYLDNAFQCLAALKVKKKKATNKPTKNPQTLP